MALLQLKTDDILYIYKYRTRNTINKRIFHKDYLYKTEESKIVYTIFHFEYKEIPPSIMKQCI